MKFSKVADAIADVIEKIDFQSAWAGEEIEIWNIDR